MWPLECSLDMATSQSLRDHDIRHGWERSSSLTLRVSILNSPLWESHGPLTLALSPEDGGEGTEQMC